MVYALTILLSAGLLFMIQLIMGKVILPWFGGTSSVWTTCMLFFQLVLLAGYAYAHATTRWLSPRGQAWVHRALMVGALGALGLTAWSWGGPLVPDDSWKPQTVANPQGSILLLLLVSIGLPFFLLSTTGPLLQRWFSLHGHGARTYRLYAVSNVGSILGLVSYPFLVERFLSVPSQAVVWSVGFLVFCAGTWWCSRGLPSALTVPPDDRRENGNEPLGAGRILTWFFLAMGASSLLLSVTNELCQEVASVPFLWMLPLVLYLATFIIAFDHPRWYRRRIFLALSAVFTVACLITASLGIRLGIVPHILSFSAFLFCLCMTCHGELAARKPAPSRLTLYFLTIAAGGAAGGLFVALAAPLLFTSYWEFNVMTAVIWAILGLLLYRERSSLLHAGDWWHFFLFAWLLAYIGVRVAFLYIPEVTSRIPSSLHLWVPAGISFLAGWAVAFPLRKKRLAASRYWPRTTLVAVIFLAESFMVLRIRDADRIVVHADRNFFGALRVILEPGREGQHPPFLQLMHGRINHGYQLQDDALGRQPVSYYGEGTGIQKSIRYHPRRLAGKPLRIGVLGLGVGTMAAYAEPGDTVRFYEINPTVIAYSQGDQPFFTYLRDCRGTVEISVGDARLLLEREEPQQFDILVMDAFSSDSVPVHLLTEEAFAIYTRHLRDEESILAINISNRFLDFRDLVATQSDHMGYVPIFAPSRPQSIMSSGAAWMILTRSREFMEQEPVRIGTLPWEPKRRIVWTDDYSNLFQVLLRDPASRLPENLEAERDSDKYP